MNSAAFPAFFGSAVLLFFYCCVTFIMCVLLVLSLWHILKGHTMQKDAAQEKAMCALLTQPVLYFRRCVWYSAVSHGFAIPMPSRTAQLYCCLRTCFAASPLPKPWPHSSTLLFHSPWYALPPTLPNLFSLHCYNVIQMQIPNLY